MTGSGLTVHYLSILIRNMLSFVHVLNLVPTMLEIAFSGIEILKTFKGAHPKKFPRRRGPKAPCWFSGLLYSTCWLCQLLLLKPLTPFFHQHCQKKDNYAHWYQFKLVELVCLLIHLLGFSPAFSWQHDKSLAWEIRTLLVAEVQEQP